MKKLVLLLAVACAGCAHIQGSRTVIGPDGRPETLSITTTRFLWASEGIVSRITDYQGFEFSLSVKKSSPDQESIAILSAALVDLAKMAAKPKTNAPPQ